jgi:hypothetical protein
MRSIGLIVALALVVATAAWAQQPNARTVQILYHNCQTADGTREHLACAQYIAGIGDQMSLNGALRGSVRPDAWRSIVKMSLCGAPSYAAMRQAFITWATRHPEEWPKARAVGVVKALREAWPCA